MSFYVSNIYSYFSSYVLVLAQAMKEKEFIFHKKKIKFVNCNYLCNAKSCLVVGLVVVVVACYARVLFLNDISGKPNYRAFMSLANTRTIESHIFQTQTSPYQLLDPPGPPPTWIRSDLVQHVVTTYNDK